MRCVILAAGEGKRMHPLTFTRPKVMLPIGNKPVLEWNLINAIGAGLEDFIFIVGYKSEIVRNYFGNGKKWKVKIEYVNQGKPQGTAHAIGVVESFIDKNFLVLCGDTIFGKNDVKKILKKENSIGIYKVENPEEYGVVDIKNSKLTKIYEKIKNPNSNLINAGIYHFNKNIFDYIKKTRKSTRGEYELTDTINDIVKKHDFESTLLDSWQDLVYPWDLLEANKEILKLQKKEIKSTFEKNVTIKGEVSIGKDTVVMNGSYIEGPVIIGNNCKIGPNCYIRPYTSIGNDCHVGNACEIKNSIIMDNSNAPHHNYIGDSVIGFDCNLGSGTKIANLRLDKKSISVIINGIEIDTKKRKLGCIIGDNVQTGINSTINTGTIISNDVFIGPGAIVKGYVEPSSKLF